MPAFSAGADSVSPASPFVERKRTVFALTSKAVPGVPSWRLKTRGPPVSGSQTRRPSNQPSACAECEIAALYDSQATRAGGNGGKFLSQFRGDDDGGHAQESQFLDNVVQTQLRALATEYVRVLLLASRPLQSEGAGKAGCRLHPWVPCKKSTGVGPQVQPETLRLSLRDGLRFTPRSPGDRAFLPPSLAESLPPT